MNKTPCYVNVDYETVHDFSIKAYGATEQIVVRICELQVTDRPAVEKLQKLSDAFARSYFVIRKPKHHADLYRKNVADKILANPANTVRLSHILACLTTTLPEDYTHASTSSLLTLLTYISNYSMHSIPLVRELCKCSDYMNTLKKLLASDYLAEIKPIISQEALVGLIVNSIRSVYSLLQHEDSYVTTRIIEHDLPHCILRYTKFQQCSIKLASVMALVFVITDVNTSSLVVYTTAQLLVKNLKDSILSADLETQYFRTVNFIHAINRLACSDAFKSYLVNNDILPCLKEVLHLDSPESQEAALCLLTTLAQDVEIRTKIQAELLHSIMFAQSTLKWADSTKPLANHEMVQPSTPSSVANSETVNTEDTREPAMFSKSAADDVCDEQKPKLDWRLKTPPYSSLFLQENDVQSVKGNSQGSPQIKDGHVFISYTHEYKDVAVKIANELKDRNIKVWIDLEHMCMETDIMDGMARAVEMASVVCILFSKEYKDSQNTQREAKYACVKKKRLIFLRAQSAYQPDGWLGIMLGTQRYIDFSGKYPFEQKLQELLITLSETTPNASQEPKQACKDDIASHSAEEADKRLSSVIGWNSTETAKWLSKHALKWYGKQPLDGRMLGFLLELQHDRPELFYGALDTFGCLPDKEDITRFVSALSILGGSKM